MNISNKEYADIVAKRSPPSPKWKTIPLAFISGGIICIIGQALLNLYKNYFSPEKAGAVTSVTLILIAAVLTGLKIYDRLGKHCGAGTLIPITGFANSVVAPAVEFKPEGMILGVGAKMFVIAGPVLVYGIAISALCGLVKFLLGFLK
ncbi:stage V sporulation protein AC [Clostridia bacterium]|nr:stage V sporulation protein AC [Clostridia bacterium]